MFKLFLSLVLILGQLSIFCQTQISGTVSDDDNLPLIGVTVQRLPASNYTGTITDVNGYYAIEANPNDTLVFSFIGMESQNIIVGNQSVINITLVSNTQLLDEVVVTAFGIEKSKKQTGFSFTEVSGEELTEARETNIASQLTGKVAGLDVTSPSNGPGGATRISIRGLSQLSGDNRPLIVVDGIPIDNTNLTTGALYGGRDSGDGLSSINPDDIENITVLKGPSAASLYGSRAGNGVIVITTKKGKKRDGFGIEFNTNFVTDRVAILPRFQQMYGQGASGLAPTTQQEALDNWQSWGAALNGQSIPIFNGDSLPYLAQGQNNIRDFYNTGHTWSNNLSITKVTEKINARLSLSQLNNQSFVPNTGYDRYTATLKIGAQITDKLYVDTKANFIKESANNRTDLSDNPSNPAKYFVVGPANLPHTIFDQTRNENGDPIYWSSNPFTLSPYWGANENINEDEKNRLIAYGLVKYDIVKGLSIQGRIATDEIKQDFLSVEIDGTQHLQGGAINDDNYDIKERNYDILLSGTKAINDNLQIDVNLGAVRTDRFFTQFRQSGSNFIESRVVSLDNMMIRNPDETTSNKSRVNAIYGNINFGLYNMLYIDGSVRRDYFSVLTNPADPENSINAISYASVATSFVFSELTKMDWLTFGKLRLGYGTSGFGQIAPYSQSAVYRFELDPKQTSGGIVTLAHIQGDSYVNPSIRPSVTTSSEIGIDLRFLKNRIGIDFTYYNQLTDKHIFNSPLPTSTGYNVYQINAGEVRNRGIETLLSLTPIQTKNVEWNIDINYASNKNKVIKLNEGVDQLNSASDRLFTANIISKVGGQIGDIWGNAYTRDDNNAIVYDDSGLPLINPERQVLGNYNPDWYGGITNTIRYKNLTFSFLIDTKQGGEILSTTSGLAYFFGTHVGTLQGRNSQDFSIIGNGVNQDGSPNTTPARLDEYYGRISSIAEENIYDASYIKLRQISLSYSIPKYALASSPVGSVKVSLVARNLLFFQNGFDEIGLDPESLYSSTGAEIGIENATLPSTRSLGMNLNLTF